MGSLHPTELRIRTLVWVWLVALTLGCASYTDDTREVRSLYKSQSYASALSKLEKSELKESSSSRLLYVLEKAMILDRLGQRKKSRALLIRGDGIVDELYTTSVSKTAASFVINDRATDYEGEDFEKVAIHAQLALSFIEDGDLQSANVSARKINNKLKEINDKHGDKKNRYGEDAFARYLSGIIYEARGEWDSAIIDYKRALDLYQGDYNRFVRGGTPPTLPIDLARMYLKRNRTAKISALRKDHKGAVDKAQQINASKKSAEIVAIHEVGHIATKSTAEFVMGIGKQVVRFSFPVIRKRKYRSWGATGIEFAKNRRFLNGHNAQYMDAIARDTLEDRRLRMVAKQTARLLAKGQLTEQAYKNFGVVGGLAANIFSAVTETADTRSWTLLPEAYFVTRVRVEPGTYDIKVKTNGRLGKIVKVHVKAGEIKLLRGVG